MSNIDGLYNGLLESESNRIPLDVLEREYRTHVKSARHLIEQAKESNDVTIVKIAHVDSAALDLDWDEEFLVNDKTNSELENGDHYFDGETLCTMIVQVQYLKEIMNSYLVCLRHEAVRSN